MNAERFFVRPLTMAVQAALVMMSGVCAAAEGEATVASLTQPTNHVEIGVENTSRDSAKFGEYNGLDKKGADAIIDFGVRGGDAYGDGKGIQRWEIRGSDLGTTAREVSAATAAQGQWNVGVRYDELRHHITDSYQTPFQGSMGGNAFTLPSSFGVIDVGGLTGTQALTAGQLASFTTTAAHTDRKNTAVTAGYIFSPQWSTQFSYNRLAQSGAKLISAATDVSGGGTSAGENGVTLMNPTNYQTDTFDLAVNWVGEEAHCALGYYASKFKDGFSAVSWSNPFVSVDGTTTGTDPGAAFPLSTFATPPDNDMQQLNFSGGINLSSTTKLAGGFSYGRNTQNVAFITDPLLTSALPQASLDGKVLTKHLDLKLTDQTTRNLQLSAGVKYNERDNQTPSMVFDSFNSIAGDNWLHVINAPESYKKYSLELAANYRFDKKQSLRFAYEYEDIKRWCNNDLANSAQSIDVVGAYPSYYVGSGCVQIAQSKENRLTTAYRAKLGSEVGVNVSYIYARRNADVNASYYNPMQTSADGLQNYGWAPFFASTRRQQAIKAGINWRPEERVNLGMSGRYVDDKYDAVLGVQKGHTSTINLDAAFNYSADGVLTGYWTTQKRQRDLASSADRSPLAAVASDTLWSNQLSDESDTLGITLRQAGLFQGKVEVKADLSYSVAKSRYATDATTCTLANDPNPPNDPICGDPTLIGGALPDIKNEATRFKLSVDYEVDKASTIVLSYLYKHLKSEDYYFGAYQYGSTDYTVLPTNQAAPDYSVNVVGVSYLYRFR